MLPPTQTPCLIDNKGARTISPMVKRNPESYSPLAKWRDRRGLTQQALAKRVHTSQQQIDRLEKGHVRMSLDWIVKLSQALDVPSAALIDGEAFDETDVALLKLLRHMSPTDKARLLRLATVLDEPTRAA